MSLLASATNENAGTSYFYTKREIDIAVSTFVSGLSTLSSFTLFNNPTVSSITVNPTSGSITGGGVMTASTISANSASFVLATGISSITSANPMFVSSIATGNSISTINLNAPVSAGCRNLTVSSINGLPGPRPQGRQINLFMTGLVPSTIVGGNGSATLMSSINVSSLGGYGVYSVTPVFQPQGVVNSNATFEMWTQNGALGQGGGKMTLIEPNTNIPTSFNPKVFTNTCTAEVYNSSINSTLNISYYLAGTGSNIATFINQPTGGGTPQLTVWLNKIA